MTARRAPRRASVAARTRAGAQGERMDMVMVAAGEVSGPEVDALWETVAKAAADAERMKS